MRQTSGSNGGLRVAIVAAGLAAALAAAPAAGAGELLAQAQRPAPGTAVQQPPSIEASIAQLHQQLRITPAQEGPFRAFAAVMRENADAAERMPPPNSRTSAVEGLRLSIQAMRQELAGLQRLLPALENLYRSLSPQQRQAADRVFSQPPG
jgi:periplasmic protein CpxP/Spy